MTNSPVLSQKFFKIIFIAIILDKEQGFELFYYEKARTGWIFMKFRAFLYGLAYEERSNYRMGFKCFKSRRMTKQKTWAHFQLRCQYFLLLQFFQSCKKF